MVKASLNMLYTDKEEGVQLGRIEYESNFCFLTPLYTEAA